MSNYYELNKELLELKISLNEEINIHTQKNIEQKITKTETEVECYDLSCDDLFKCEECRTISDIENSVSKAKGLLICESCSNK